MQQLVKSLVLIFLCLSITPVSSADPIADIYQVEVLVFEHLDANRFRAEHWPKFVAKIDANRAVDLDNLHSQPAASEALEELDALDEPGEKPLQNIIKESINLAEPKTYLLSKEERMIKASKVERFIKHIAWNQPLANNVKSTPVYFTAGKDKELEALIAIKPTRNIITVYIDMNYKIQPEDQKDNPGVTEIKLVRDVRVKKKEVYYVDHPVLGVMLIVSPVVLGTNSYAPLPNM